MLQHRIALAFGLCLSLLPACSRERPWQLGERHTYDVTLHSQYGVADSDPLVAVDLTAKLELTPVSRDETTAELSARLVDPVLSLRQSGQQVTAVDKIAADLRAPFLFTLSDGRLRTNRVAPGSNALAIGVMRTLASVLQSNVSDRMEVTEADSTGEYVAAYERIGADRVRKQKLRYLSWHSASTAKLPLGAAPELPHIDSSMLELQGNGAVYAQVTLDEQLTTVLSRVSKLQSRTKLQLRAHETHAHVLTETERYRLYAATAPLPLDQLPAQSMPADNGLDQAKLADLSLDQVLAGLEEQASSKPTEGEPTEPDQVWMAEQTKLFAALNASLRQRTETVRDIEQRIRADSPARDVLISGLGAAGTSEGHELLLRLMADASLPDQVRKACGLSLIRTPKPSPAAIRGVEARFDDPSWHKLAVYGLGSYARLLRESGQAAESSRLTSVLLQRFHAATSVRAKVDLLYGLSNSGSLELLVLVRAGLISDPNKEIREAAVTALRLIELPEAEQLVLDTLASDGEQRVRLAALRAVKKHAPSPRVVQALTSAAVGDLSERIRYEAVRQLTSQRPQQSGLRATLDQVAKKDTNETVRNFASAELAALDTRQSKQAQIQ